METAKLLTRAYWQSLAPHFHIAEQSFCSNIAPIAPTPQRSRERADLLRTEGYFHETDVDWGVDLSAMAELVKALTRNNLSPAFAFLYDELWYPFYKLHLIYSSLLGGKYCMLPDCWVWDVDPKRGEAGWKHHRDKPGRVSLFNDGTPKSLTTWIPLTRATPLNGCMYIVPAFLDPTYGTERHKSAEFELSSIRALPAKPGDFFIWNQAVMHWGSKSSPRGEESRVSMAFELQRADVPPFNQPLLPALAILPFEARLKLISKQMLQYRHMYKLEPSIEQLAIRLLS